MRRLCRFWNAWWAFATALRYATKQNVWTDADRRALASFLNSPTGVKMERLMADHILDNCQTVVSEQAKPFDVGTVHGMKILWVFMKTLTAAGVAPEDDQTL